MSDFDIFAESGVTTEVCGPAETRLCFCRHFSTWTPLKEGPPTSPWQGKFRGVRLAPTPTSCTPGPPDGPRRQQVEAASALLDICENSRDAVTSAGGQRALRSPADWVTLCRVTVRAHPVADHYLLTATRPLKPHDPPPRLRGKLENRRETEKRFQVLPRDDNYYHAEACPFAISSI